MNAGAPTLREPPTFTGEAAKSLHSGGSAPAPVKGVVEAYLHRTERTDKHTLGQLFIEGERFFVLERPWLDNRSNVSCIPAGNYKATYLARSASGKYKRVYWIRNVPGRGGILIHNGNLTRHSWGCLLIGLRCGYLQGERAVLNSRTALNEFVELMARRELDISISDSV